MPEDVYGWLASLDLSIIIRTGVRILYDYLPRDILGQRSFEDILDMERRHCHQSAFIDLGRYIHVLSQLQS
jgi:S-adenosylmethionine-dependent methyltransferase